MIYNNILDAMGNTPLIRLNRMVEKDSAQILVKFEGLNVGGSIKTRTAYNMIREAEEQGLINEDTIIVEPTSGNQGIGLALVGAVRGYQTKIIMPDSVSEERRKLVKHYGAEVILIHDAQRVDLLIPHGYPGPAQACLSIHTLHAPDIHVPDLGAYVRIELGGGHLKIIQNKL